MDRDEAFDAAFEAMQEAIEELKVEHERSFRLKILGDWKITDRIVAQVLTSGALFLGFSFGFIVPDAADAPTADRVTLIAALIILVLSVVLGLAAMIWALSVHWSDSTAEILAEDDVRKGLLASSMISLGVGVVGLLVYVAMTLF